MVRACQPAPQKLISISYINACPTLPYLFTSPLHEYHNIHLIPHITMCKNRENQHAPIQTWMPYMLLVYIFIHLHVCISMRSDLLKPIIFPSTHIFTHTHTIMCSIHNHTYIHTHTHTRIHHLHATTNSNHDATIFTCTHTSMYAIYNHIYTPDTCIHLYLLCGLANNREAHT
jgi:hypothetical protein